MIKVGSESFRKCPCTSKLSLSLVRCSPTKSEIIPEIWSGSFSPKTSCSGKHRWRWILGRLKSANYRPEFALLNHISKPISKYLSNHSNWKQLKSAQKRVLLLLVPHWVSTQIVLFCSTITQTWINRGSASTRSLFWKIFSTLFS